jgi:F0F1-type ATP synthase beta subunit
MQENDNRLAAIESYIRAYNGFDVEKMLSNLHENIEFENVSNGEVNLRTDGIAEFKTQAEKAKSIFSQREQKITNLHFDENKAEVEISYTGILAIDLPNGLKSGSKIELRGQSIFTFQDDKIIKIEDIS